MDTRVVAAPEVARALGVSLPTAHKALDRAGVPRVGRGHTRVAPEGVVKTLVAERGSTPPSDRDPADLRVLAVLSHSPLGQASARSVASRAGLSPTTTSRALQRLAVDRLVEQRDLVVPSGRARHEKRWFVNTPAWLQPLVDQVRSTRLPRRKVQPSPLPVALHHLFWNADVTTLDPAVDGSYMAGRLLEAPDIRAWTWALANISRVDIKTALGRRGVKPATRALVENWWADEH
ncbi:MarR family transcriptional regulator [Microbacterium protaetiae]|uniref:MarR family transcriptional regulator n=1 Tax=Microbacterium protaetiae TaxID=2509458 RepID=A0A4P6EFE0_9MICO|nr:helix-turn-helix domain-containing protein [Microbacterium protaetiae]QAY61082.1 MarR family transcriptional regulator [Microbacterium protaetiae]